jgi:subtilase family serine protease
MKKSLLLVLTVMALVVVSASSFAQDRAAPAKGTIVAPPSTLVGTGGVHSSLYVFVPEGGAQTPVPSGETPASIACIYGVTAPTPGCPKNGTVLATGGSRAIAVVVYGHYQFMQRDLNTFSDQFGLPRTTVTEICSPGPPPCPNNEGSGWDLVTAAALEWAHAMAPNAQLILSEFTSDWILDGEVQAAAAAVSAVGGGEVISTLGLFGGESCDSRWCERDYDYIFQHDGVVFFNAAGTQGDIPAWPSVSPNVVSAGGTTIIRDSNGNFTGEEDCWSQSGGGISLYEPLPQYQLMIGNITGPKRGTPDMAAVADPNTGVDVYGFYCGGWCVVGGTANSATLLAGIVNAAGNFYSSTQKQLSKEYMEYRIPGLYHQYFYDVTQGSNGSQAKLGWDQCTGLGSPRKLIGF